MNDDPMPDAPMFDDPMLDNIRTEWWLASLGRTIVWARLRVLEAGTAEVFDSDGNTLAYDSEDSARAALMDAEFVSWDAWTRTMRWSAVSRSAKSHRRRPTTTRRCAHAWC